MSISYIVKTKSMQEVPLVNDCIPGNISVRFIIAGPSRFLIFTDNFGFFTDISNDAILSSTLFVLRQ